MTDYKKEFKTARNILNGKGFIGRIAKLFFGKNTMSEFANSVSQAESQLTYHQIQQEIKESGTPAKAEVLKIADTGMLVNNNPVAQVTLKIMPDNISEYTVTIRTTLSKVNIPRIGDIIKIKYNPDNTNEIVIVY